ncbi:MAG: bifunctional diguanylate cyclase/phosphodiesterase [Microthrixaceae bacterium]
MTSIADTVTQVVAAMPHAAAVVDTSGVPQAVNAGWPIVIDDLIDMIAADEAAPLRAAITDDPGGASDDGDDADTRGHDSPERTAQPVPAVAMTVLLPAVERSPRGEVVAGERIATTVRVARLAADSPLRLVTCEPLGGRDLDGPDRVAPPARTARSGEPTIDLTVDGASGRSGRPSRVEPSVGDPVAGRAATAPALPGSSGRAIPGRRMGLPDVALFTELLAHSMTLSERHRFLPSVLAVGFSGLDEVEEQFGHAARRGVAQEAISRLRSGLRPGDVIAVTDDPESLLVLLPDIDGEYLAEAVSHRLGAEIGRPYRVLSSRPKIGLLVGVAVSGEDRAPQAVVASAIRALAQARGRVDDPVFGARVMLANDGGVAESTSGRPDLDLADLRDDELVAYFQPIVDMHSGAAVAAEALARWRHPHYGMLSAGEFLNLPVNTESLNLICDQALVRAVESWADVRDGFVGPPPKLFVNLRPDQLLGRGAIERIYHLLVANGVNPTDTVVEVTEEAVVARFEDMVEALRHLRRLGMRVALDDFGSGHSSLGRLASIPLDVLKIDKSLVSGCDTDHRGRQVLSAVSMMSRALDLDCVVEGIETAAEAAIVGELGFRYAQGYYYACPDAPERFVDLTTVAAQKVRADLAAASARVHGS